MLLSASTFRELSSSEGCGGGVLSLIASSCVLSLGGFAPALYEPCFLAFNDRYWECWEGGDATSVVVLSSSTFAGPRNDLRMR
jgi:hypothetical protein